MEARLSAALPGERPAAPVEDANEGAPNAWPDESAEVAILSELSQRGEKPALAATEPVEETNTRDLPPLDELVKRLSPEVRETLDNLFRVRFIAVRRVPQKALQK